MSMQSNGQSRDVQRPHTFNPNDYVVHLKNKAGTSEYLPVQWRLVWFRERFPNGSIETEILHLDLDRETEEEIEVWNSEAEQNEKVTKHGKGLVIFKATVKDGKGGVASGTKMEKAASFSDWLEKAETGAIGRALAGLGFGTQFAPELSEEHRIVDSPVARKNTSTNGNLSATRAPIGNAQQTINNKQLPLPEDLQGAATEQQLTGIRKLCEHLGKAEPENITKLTSLNARKLIQQLSAEYQQSKQGTKVS
ncbi:MAG: hypothetical protein E6J34_08105 [Chloroflexi bacterium]|nr:MAG: hypothetical protein E6J34_08105 [Chloroflexota bacterium]